MQASLPGRRQRLIDESHWRLRHRNITGSAHQGGRLKVSPAAAPAVRRHMECALVAQAAQAKSATGLNANQHAAAAAAADDDDDCCNAAAAHSPPSPASSSAVLLPAWRTCTPPCAPPPPPCPPSPCAAQPAGRTTRCQASGRLPLDACTTVQGLGGVSRDKTAAQRSPLHPRLRGGAA